MEEQRVYSKRAPENLANNLKVEEDEEEFRSCCEDEDELRERENSVKEASETIDLDEYSVRMYFKGISVAAPGESGSGFSGIGVVMERSANAAPIQVQKKLDFYVAESVANYLALMDGLVEAKENKIRKVFAFTDSKILHDQVMHGERLEDPLLMALKQRILEHTCDLEAFTLDFVPRININALGLAQVAVGVIAFPAEGNQSTQSCSICCDEKLASMMMTMKCSHKFCSHCMKQYVEDKIQFSQVPVRCPQLKCKYYLSATECKTFLPVISYQSLEKALADANILNSDSMYCPYPNCSVLLDPNECSSSRASSSSNSENSCVECPVCQRFICVDCGVPWHSSTTCEEYQSLPLEERDASDITLCHPAQNKRWRRCGQCHRMIELMHGRYRMRCWCGHEFCYSCGSNYCHGQQTCQCTFWDEDYSEDLVNHPPQEFEQWAWDSFEPLPLMMDAYSDQERSQLALIQRFLAGGFSLTDSQPDQSPPRCTDTYAETMKNLHQLPWLERFVSVISDDFYEDYFQ
ncbi:ATP-dependent RNA helicase DEAH12, chloroplastic-like [Coffea arabica]|uniref:RBR-type E3 ubiquitin transferase n=1 Tax=Coffea arabica TaxID=13443 RepID=A0A6P6UEV7_COFAR|nr:ATP-dependent RNA helicase DEAH12, chloroplastic-like [Coffea arabica]XP_027089089.1 ATP-dependent RNA helicase DEAH12, chloroplastic-like [Coffea arabica]